MKIITTGFFIQLLEFCNRWINLKLKLRLLINDYNADNIKAGNNKWGKTESLSIAVNNDMKDLIAIPDDIKLKPPSIWISWRDIKIIIILFIILLVITNNYYIDLIIANWFSLPTDKIYLNLHRVVDQRDCLNLQNITNIHSGISSVLIALSFFIANEVSRERVKKYYFSSHILMRRSNFVSMLLSSILIFLLLMPESLNLIIIFPIIALVLMLLYSLYRSFDLLMKNNSLLSEEESNIFDQILQSSFFQIIHNEISETIGNKYIRDFLSANIVDSYMSSTLLEEEYISIQLRKNGVVKDIKWSFLKKVLAITKHIENNSKLSKDNNRPTNKLTIENKRFPEFYMQEIFKLNTNYYNKGVFWIRKDLARNKLYVKKITKLINAAFVVNTQDDRLKKSAIEIGKIRHRAVISLKENDLSDFKKELRRYNLLFQNLNDSIQITNKATRHFFNIGTLEAVKYLCDEILKISEQAINNNNSNGIKFVDELILHILRLEIENYNFHLLHHLSQQYFFGLYKEHKFFLNNDNKNLSTTLLNLCWGFLKFLFIRFLAKRQDNENKNDIKLACFVMKLFQDFLKLMFDDRDYKNFIHYSSEFNNFIKRQEYFLLGDSKNIEKRLGMVRMLTDELFIGMSACLIFLVRMGKDRSEILSFYNSVQAFVPQDITRLTNAFHRARLDGCTFWAVWSGWENTNRQSYEVVENNVLEKLNLFYVVHLILLISKKTDDQIKAIRLPQPNKLTDINKAAEKMIEIADEIKINQKKWGSVFNENHFDKIELVKLILRQAITDSENLHKVNLRNEKISHKMVDEFRTGFQKVFTESATIRDLFANFFEDAFDKSKLCERTKDEKLLQISEIGEKGAFIENWHIYYANWDNVYGNSLAYWENIHLVSRLSSNCHEVYVKNFKFNLDESLSKIKDPSKRIILAVKVSFLKISQEIDNFVFINKSPENSTLSNISYEGMYQFDGENVPVFRADRIPAYQNYFDKQVLVLNKSKAGQLIQYSPLGSSGLEEFLLNVPSMGNILYMRIRPFSEDEELMKKTLSIPPSWLQKIVGKSEQREALQERVLIEIFEAFEFKSMNSKGREFQGYKLLYKDD